MHHPLSDKYEDIPVECTGEAVPKPIERFEDAKLVPVLMENIRRADVLLPSFLESLSSSDLIPCTPLHGVCVSYSDNIHLSL